MTTIKRKIMFAAGLTVVAGYLAWPFIQALGNRIIRFVNGQHLLGGATLLENAHENLPSVAVESGRTLCCRMSFCDFRFPLPAGTQVASIGSVTGGADTIKGTICVTNIAGGTVHLRAYGRALRRNGFSVNGDDSVGITASSPDGGFVGVQDSNDSCEISFSFFGDY